MERVDILIDGKRFANWQSVTITLSVDTFSTVTLTAPFEPDRKSFRETFRPFSFKPLVVRLQDGTPLFTGTLVDVRPSLSANGRTVEVSGYALPGVLQDCSAPATVKRQFNKLGLRAIAEQICAPFGLKFRMLASEGAPFRRVKLKDEDLLFPFLTELAKQRNLILSNTAQGQLLCWRSAEVGSPVAIFEEGKPPVSVVNPEFNPQDYFSEITGICGRRRGRKGSKHTEQNPWLGKLRPITFKLEDTDPGDAPEATRAKLGRMFANVAAFTIEDLPSWRDPQGDLWTPNTTLQITAPGAMIYRRSELLIRNVALTQDASKESATLGLVLPGAFSGEPPPKTAFLPWDEPI